MGVTWLSEMTRAVSPSCRLRPPCRGQSLTLQRGSLRRVAAAAVRLRLLIGCSWVRRRGTKCDVVMASTKKARHVQQLREGTVRRLPTDACQAQCYGVARQRKNPSSSRNTHTFT